MGVALEIEDGSPNWFLSQAIRFFSVDDPAIEVVPEAGVACLIQATVANRGDTTVEDAEVRFYSANPNVGFDRNTATRVGTAFVSLNAGDVGTSLCLTAWTPPFMSDGHVCVLAEAFHDPLDLLPPVAAFDVAGDRHVAQRNLMLSLTSENQFHLRFEIHNRSPETREFEIRADQKSVKTAQKLLGPIWQKYGIQGNERKFSALGFTDSRCPGPQEVSQLENVKRISVKGGATTALTLAGQLPGGVAFVTVNQIAADISVGGLGVIVIGEK